MDYCGLLWIMDYGLLWIMDYYGLLWIIMGYYGLLWIIMDYYGLLRIMDYYGFIYTQGIKVEASSQVRRRRQVRVVLVVANAHAYGFNFIQKYFRLLKMSDPPDSKFHWVPGPSHEKGRSALLPVVNGH